tara:strand:+ start:909 stop:1274 length:366 start_codon:yes stop_codon:yes gene_type:complete
MSGIIGQDTGMKSGIVGGSGLTSVIVYNGAGSTGGAGPEDVTTLQPMSNFNWLTFVHGDGSYVFSTIAHDAFANNPLGFTHGHMLVSYDNHHIYARWVDDNTIDIYDGSAGCKIYRIYGLI